METLKRCAALSILLVGAGAPAQNDSLFAQSAQASLTKASTSNLMSSRVSWLLMDARSGQLLASRWSDPDLPIPVGSLTKPFVALAYARTHTGFPRYFCTGSAGRCWLTRGHGTLGFEQALTFSCNSYFLRLAKETAPTAMQEVALEYGLPVAPSAANPEQLIGLEASWRVSPLELGRAYLRLANQPDAGAVRAAMRRAAVEGTAAALSAEDALAKTGTAHCIRDCLASGDGLVVALTPSDSPRLLLLVRERGTNGAAAAKFAAQLLHTLRGDHVIEY